MNNQLEPSRGNRQSLNPIDRMFQSMFDDFFSSGSGRDSFSSGQSGLSCDISESEDAYLVSVDLPGVDRKDIDINVSGNMLTISGERREERSTDESSGKKPRFTERRYGSFQRSFTLPNGIKSEKVEASYQDGVLSIAIPKAEESKSRKIDIKEGSSGFLGRLKGKKDKTVDVDRAS